MVDESGPDPASEGEQRPEATAPDRGRQASCPRCGTGLADFAPVCHRCGLRLDPGVAYFAGTGSGDAGASIVESGQTGAEVAFERRHLSCLPMDLERVARAEAVDGWALLDTTLDPDVPGNIVAHLRRPVRAPADAAAPPTTPPKGGPDGSRAARGAGRRGVGTGPASQPVASLPVDRPVPAGASRQDNERTGDPRLAIYAVLLVTGMVWSIDQFGIGGLLIALFVLPGLLRAILGIRRRERPRRR
jgi:hypothetical protein